MTWINKNDYLYSLKNQLRDRLGGKTRVMWQEGQHKIKVIIIIVLKLDSRVNLWQDLVQCNDKICYFHSFKINSGVDRGKTHVTGQKGQYGLTKVNVWIKMIIILVLKPDSGIDSKQGLGHGSRGSTWLAQIFIFK
jgi:hypothetical protein